MSSEATFQILIASFYKTVRRGSISRRSRQFNSAQGEKLSEESADKSGVLESMHGMFEILRASDTLFDVYLDSLKSGVG